MKNITNIDDININKNINKLCFAELSQQITKARANVKNIHITYWFPRNI